MSIRVQCPGCRGRFQAPDRLAGKQARCPHCSAAISVPAGAPPETTEATSAGRPLPRAPADPASSSQEVVWYVQTSDGSKHGPMTQAQLERLVSLGRLDGFSRLRHQTWSDWKWAEDLFPQLTQLVQSASTGDDTRPASAVEPLPAEPSGESTAPKARVVTCPDCGNTVSTRASQCPHCGCPAKLGPGQNPAIPASRRRVAWVVGSVAALLVIAVAGFGIGWWLWGDRPRLSQDEPEAPAPVDEPARETEPPAPPPAVSPSEIEAALQQAAAEEARRLDAEFRTAHSAKKLIEQAELSADLIQALAQGDLDAIPDSLPAELAPENSTPYQSLHDSLYHECLAYLRANVSREEFTGQAVKDAVRRWEEEKRALLQRQLTEELEKHLVPSGQPR